MTIVELVDVAQLEGSVGMGMYPEGHVASTVATELTRQRPETSIVNPVGQIFGTVTADPDG